jgi:mRNA-degrading endonuclease toxin of MazEF toxin-antitoxin module
MAAKVRPRLILTPQPRGDDLEVFTAVAHMTAVRDNRREVPILKSFLDGEGAFDVQGVVTVAGVKLERKLGELTGGEMDLILDRPPERLGL